MPDWTSTVFPEYTLKLALQEYYVQTTTKQLRKLVVGKYDFFVIFRYAFFVFIGQLMQKILIDTKAKINGTSNCKIHLYSCHDNNIANALIFFGLLAPNYFPKYAACIVVEIHKINKKYVIKVCRYSAKYVHD